MLPEMTAMFFDGFASHMPDGGVTEQPDIRLKSDLKSRVQFLRLPVNPVERRQSPGTIKDEATTRHGKPALEVYHREDQFTQLRSFILNLSHAYNNLLMGALGQATLIKMELKDDPETIAHLNHMEHLIHTGANLTNLIFGYLVERRLSARRLQLIQLFGEFELCSHEEQHCIDIQRFKQNMRRVAALNDQPKIIAAVARVIGQLLSWLKDESTTLSALNAENSRIRGRLETIDGLLDRGFGIVQDLKYYARDNRPVIRRMSLRTLVQEKIEQFRLCYTHVVILEDLPKRWPWIFADRRQIAYAIGKVFENAVQAMPCGGRLSIRVRTLTNELPSDRCAVHSGGDYVVVTIADSGFGMDINTQARIFQPFFKIKADGISHHGLGLPAAGGIIKSHGGFIQVRSSPGKGSRFKIYLPIKENGSGLSIV